MHNFNCLLPNTTNLPFSMHRSRSRLLLVIVGLFALSGANCPNMVRPAAPPLPRVLPPSPTLDQLIQVVNRNNSQIQSFYTDHATLSGPGFPAIRARIAFQRPRCFRLVWLLGFDRSGGRLGLQSRFLLVLGPPQRSAGNLLLPPRSICHQSGPIFHSSSARLVDRGLGRNRNRSCLAASRAVSVAGRSLGTPHNSRNARWTGHKDHDFRRGPRFDSGTAYLQCPGLF